MSTENRVFNKLFKNSKHKFNKNRVSLDLFASYKASLQGAMSNFEQTQDEMASLASELTQKEQELQEYRTEYFIILSEYVADVESKFKDLGLDSLPNEWRDEFENLTANIPETASLQPLIDQVQNILK